MRVLWVDPYPTRLVRLSDLKLPTVREGDVTNPESGITVFQPKSLPIEPLPLLGRVNNAVFWRNLIGDISELAKQEKRPVCLGVGKPSRLAATLLRGGIANVSFYDAMDDFPAFYGGVSRRSMHRVENKILSSVDLVTVSSHALRKKMLSRGRKSSLIPNACLAPQFNVCSLGGRTWQPPLIFGYVGTVGRWFDWGVVLSLLESFPGAECHIVGSLHVEPPRSLPDRVRFFPPCEHERVYEVIAAFHIGLIPFKVNPLTECVDPIKLYEYLAVGKPVISTEFGEMRYHSKLDGVFLYAKDEIPRLVLSALSYSPDERDVQRFVDNNKWSSRFSVLASELESLIDCKPARNYGSFARSREG